MAKLHGIKKLALVEYRGILGHEVICKASKPDGEPIERKEQLNHSHDGGPGIATFSFGEKFAGDVVVEFEGTGGGVDGPTTITIP